MLSGWKAGLKPGRRQNNKRFCSQKGIQSKSSKSSRITLSVASSLNDDFSSAEVSLSLSFTRHFVKLDSGNRRTVFTLQLHPIRRLSIRHADSNWRRQEGNAMAAIRLRHRSLQLTVAPRQPTIKTKLASSINVKF